MIYKNTFISIILTTCILFFWYSSFKFSCMSLSFLFFILVVISKNIFEYLRIKRRCVADCYFNKNNWIYFFYTRVFFLLLWSGIVSIITTLAVGIYLINVSYIDIILILFSFLIIVFLIGKFEKIQIFNQKVKIVVSKNFVSWSGAIVVTILLFILNFNSTPPSYIDNSMLKTIENASLQNYSNCNVINGVLQLSQEVNAIKWWIILKFSIVNENQILKWFVWIIFLIPNFLAIWGIDKLFVEIYFFSLDLLRKGNDERK